VSYVAASGKAVTLLRVEGPGPSVEHRCAALRGELARFGATEELHSANSALIWREIADVALLRDDGERVIWRLSLPPASAPALIAALARQIEARHFFDWGGGLVWLAVGGGPGDDDGGAAAIRAALAGFGGYATLIRGGAALRSVVPVFEPQGGALAALSARVKESFDPRRILNPGRMYRDL
jgi:glycolate oxidase FAD binding subunit